MCPTTADSSSDPNVRKAIALLNELAAIPPQHASADTVRSYLEAADLLADCVDTPLWLDARLGLASHLLEIPDGARHDNVMMARQVYSELQEMDSEGRSFDQWLAVVMGLGNTILADPGASPEDMAGAAEYFDGLIPVVRESGTPVQLATTLGQAAAAHGGAQSGDADRERETAIRLQAEVIDLLAGADDPEAKATLARAHYNLGRYHAESRVGVRSQNVDRAVHAFRSACDMRPADEDPVGRARALRALALVYPEWTGADSLDHAAELASAAEAEATHLAETDLRESRRDSSQATLARNRSALRVDFDWLYAEPPEHRRALLEEHIAFHREVLDEIDSEKLPAVWAEWAAGLARLLGRLSHVGASEEEMKSAYQYFNEAWECLDSREHPRLYRDIMAAAGELSHEIGDFAASYRTHFEAADLSASMLAHIADPEHRLTEIQDTRGYGLFGAYAAAMVGQPEDAARLAEMECNRSIAPLLEAKAAMESASPDRRDAILASFSRIQSVENELRGIGEDDTEFDVERVYARVADYVGLDPSLIGFRRVDEHAYEADPHAAKREGLRDELAEQRRELRKLLVASDNSHDSEQAQIAGFDGIRSVAETAKTALVYLIATVHGGAAIVVLPDGNAKVVSLDELSSALTGHLVNGTEQQSGFWHARGLDIGQLDQSLADIEAALTPALMEPLIACLQEHRVDRLVLIPLARLRLLPLHSVVPPSITCTYAPSARSLAPNLSAIDRPVDGQTLVVANPSHTDADSLTFAVAEGRWIANLAGASVNVLVSDDASYANVASKLPDCATSHFACHALFRPADPMESMLALADDDALNLGELFFGRISIPHARLAVLSACDTGSVESYRASDEATGFPAGLMLAGVPGVVSAMWPVDDAAAMFFMTRFYELVFEEHCEPVDAVVHAREWLRGAPVTELLDRIAKLKACLQPQDTDVADELDRLAQELPGYQSNGAPFSSPSDWAAFCMTGL